MPPPTRAAPATLTPQPTTTVTASPTVPATPTPMATATLFVYDDPVDRACPDPPPGKPDYDRLWLARDPWPTPAATAEPHFWLSHPLPRGDRLLASEILPYGSDGNGRYLLHNGVDLAEPEGTPVLAVADGLILVAGPDDQALYGWRCDWYGHLVVLLLDDRWRDEAVMVLYGHVRDVAVGAGQRVRRGEPVAAIGRGGAALLPHLHLEVRLGENTFGATRNPLLWIDPGAGRGVLAGRLVDPEGRPWQGYPITISGRGEDTVPFRQAWTYVGNEDALIAPDEDLAENFVAGDLKPGLYEVSASVQGEIVRAEVEVVSGQVSRVELLTAPYKTPTPVAGVTVPAP